MKIKPSGNIRSPRLFTDRGCASWITGSESAENTCQMQPNRYNIYVRHFLITQDKGAIHGFCITGVAGVSAVGPGFVFGENHIKIILFRGKDTAHSFWGYG